MAVFIALLLALQQTPAPEPKTPVAHLGRVPLNVLYWEGSFGSYYYPAVGSSIGLDLSAVGTKDLLTASLGDEKPAAQWPFDFLKVESDKTTGDKVQGWYRRVILKGRFRGAQEGDRTMLEFTVRYEVESFEEREDGRRVKLRGNMTHYGLTLHSLRADDTVREYARAIRSERRD